MTVRDILKESALLMGEESLAIKIEQKKESEDEEINRKVNLLLTSYNAVQNDIALNYQPLETSVEVKDKSIAIESLNPYPIKILAVYDENGNKIPFKVDDGIVYAKSKCAKIRYNYIPKDCGIEDDFAYLNQSVGKWAFTYGVSAQYCLSEGRYEESANWESRYRQISNVMKPYVHKRLKAGVKWGL
jgi:hypothetical protein